MKNCLWIIIIMVIEIQLLNDVKIWNRTMG